MVIYSNGCPKCKILEQKLIDKEVKYEKVSDMDIMIDLGIKSVPVLKVEEELLDFAKAVSYVNNL